MPLFTLHRNYSLSTNKGRTFTFIKNEPIWVPPMCVPDVVAIGAKPVDAADGDVLPPEQNTAPVTASEKQDKILAAIETLMLRNQRGDFTASGLPHPKRIEALSGFELTNTERDHYWQLYKDKKQDELDGAS